MIPRLQPDVAWPAYTYVPGRAPHPVHHPAGHSAGKGHCLPMPLDPDQPRASPTWLLALDLFNHGFYWEAHEAWESLWHAAGRSGPEATLLKALIKLAAAGVKLYEGRPKGARRHAARSLALLQRLRTEIAPRPDWAGLSLAELEMLAINIDSPRLLDVSAAATPVAAAPIAGLLGLLRLLPDAPAAAAPARDLAATEHAAPIADTPPEPRALADHPKQGDNVG